VGMVDETVNEEKPSWLSFFAWPIVGAALAFSVLSAMTVGIFILPIALVGLFALLKWGGNRKSSAGLISGIGFPLIYIAFLNRDGPGMVCGSYKNGGGNCTQEYSPWPWLFLGLALVILGGVLFLQLRRKVGSTPELGHDEEVVATVPTPHPLDLPINARACKHVAMGAAMWTLLGSIVAINGLFKVDQDARPFLFATILLATLAGIGAVVSALRGKRRGAILFLFASAIYPTYFFWVLSFIPIVLAGYLLLSPFMSTFQKPLKRRRNIQVLSFLTISIIAGLAWWNFHVDPMASAESKRVLQGFQQMSLTVSSKEGFSTPWLVPTHVGRASYPDGSKASLWVPKPSPQGNRSNCFYLDERRNGGASGFSDSSCAVQTSPVILERQGSIVVGFVSMARATQASVSVLDLTFKVPITYGYFLVPGDLSVDPNAKFTITFSEPTGSACKVTDVLAPGSSASEECVIS
jgi:hypothetical protein